MKTRLRENKLGLFLLGMPILGLIVLWNINVYKIWYDHTPWVKLEPSPSKVVIIHYVSFPYSRTRLPELSVYAEDKKVHHMNGDGQWDSAYRPDYLQLGRIKASTIPSYESVCVTKIQIAWALDDEQDQNATIIYTRGSCAYRSSDDNQYAVYKIMQNDDIWVKYVTDEKPREFRKWVTFSICLFLALSSPFWIHIFADFDFLKLKPDYDAK